MTEIKIDAEDFRRILKLIEHEALGPKPRRVSEVLQFSGWENLPKLRSILTDEEYKAVRDRFVRELRGEE